MRPQVDTTEPRVLRESHLRNNLKKEQLLEERYAEIDRANRLLLQRMSDIMRSTGGTERPRSGPPSLNRDSRKHELMRITKENQQILSRIQKAQPAYNHVEWEDAYKRNTTLLQNMCEYPLALPGRKQKKPLTYLVPIQSADGVADVMETSRASDLTGLTAPATRERDTEEDDEMKYVLKEGKRIGQHYFLIEMATDGKTLAISAYDGDRQKTLELLVSEANHRRLYRDANGDYSIIAQLVSVEDDRLVLNSDADGVQPLEQGDR